MSFLGTAFLFALPLAAAPLLLHLFDRRRNAVIEWGAMQFLMEASTQKTSARKLKQWLLLLLRVLAIVALVMALARPLLPAGLLGSNDRGETVFVVDNSMSMSRSLGDGDAGDGTMMDAVQRNIADHVKGLPPRHTVRLLTTAPYPEWTAIAGSRSATSDHEQVMASLEKLASNQGQSDLLAALFEAVTADAEPTQSSRSIVVLTDGQSADWRLADEAGWKRFRETLSRAAVPTSIDAVRLDEELPAAVGGNIAIDSMSIGRGIAGVGQPVKITATLHNYGLTDVDPGRLSWIVDGEEMDSSPVDIIAGEQTLDVSWTHTFDIRGTSRVSARLEHDDALVADNELSLVVDAVDEIPIVIVEESFDLAEMQQDSYFVQAALGYVNGEALEARSIYRPTLMAPEELATADLSKQRVVVVPNLTDLPEDVVDVLEEFVAEGGGLWIATGPRTDVDFFNHHLFADASGLAPAKLDQIVEGKPSNDQADAELSIDEGETPEQTRIDPFRSEHRATQQLADDSQLDLAETAIQRRFQFAAGDRMDDLSVLLSLNNGQPLAIENFYGRGRVIVQGVPLRMQWSDLARTQAFVVMVRDWVDYLAEPRATQFNLQPGEPIVYPLAADITARDDEASTDFSPTALLTTPAGDGVELTALRRDDVYEIRSSRTRLPGDYDLEVGLGESAVPFHVQRSTAESNLASLSSDDAARIASGTTAEWSEEQAVRSSAAQSDPVWPYLLMGLIGLITAELVLSSVLSRERFGSAGVPEHADVDADALGSTVGSTAGRNRLAQQARHAETPSRTEVG